MKLFLLLALVFVLGACASAPRGPVAVVQPTVVPACADCGKVMQVETIRAPAPRPASAGVLAGVLAKPSAQSGKTAPPTYRVFIQMDDGRRLMLQQAAISPRLRIGSTVRVSDGRVVLLR